MFKKFSFYIKRIKEGRLQEIARETAWLYSYVQKYKGSIVVYILVGILSTILTLISTVLSKNLVDMITKQQEGLVFPVFFTFLGFTVFNIIVMQISSYLTNMISLKVENSIKSDIFDKMLLTQLEPIMGYHSGDLASRLNDDATNIANGVLGWIPDLIIYSVRFIAAFGLVIYYDATFAILALIGLPVSALMSKRLLLKMRENSQKTSEINAHMHSFHQESFANIQLIKAFDLIPAYSSRLKDMQDNYYNVKKGFQRLNSVASVIMSLVGIVVSYSCYGLGIIKVFNGEITYGTMTLFLSMTSSLTSTLNALISLIPTAITISTSAERIMTILNMPKEDFSKREEVETFYKANKDQGFILSCADLSYGYPNGKNVLSQVNFQANPHEIVAIIGGSGQGKTTFLRLLLCLLSPASGRVSIATPNGNTVEHTPSIRQLFSYVPQGNTCFSGTIAENMRDVKPDATDEQIKDCLESACAWEFISELPEGIHTSLGEHGAGLSEGQSQRISIARALLRQSPIVLLDEATSALDMETEHKIVENIAKDSYPRTCIVVTHRKEILEVADKIYKIENGKMKLS